MDLIHRSLIRRPLTLLRENLRAYLLLTLLGYGLTVLAMLAGMLMPELAERSRGGLETSGDADLIASLLSRPWLFALTILAVNTTRVALASILLPSLVVPWAGIVAYAWHAVSFGLTLAPTDPQLALVLIPHALTLVIELQAYILLLMGIHLLARAWVRPASVGEERRGRAYLRGLQQLGRLAVPAAALLVLGAAYEAFEITVLVPRILGVAGG